MTNTTSLLIAFAAFSLGSAADANSQPNPLQPFERLIGGEWHLENTYQEFEWGVGRRSVKARSYFIVDGETKLVSEGAWYWHPGLQQIKGVFTAIDMPVVVFDYTTRFEGDTMRNDLKAYAENGNETVFEETWQFVDDSQLEWKLTSVLDDGTKAVMSGTYIRTSPAP